MVTWTLERERESRDAAMDEAGRYYFIGGDGRRRYGYETWLSGAYICLTCGHLCDCGWE